MNLEEQFKVIFYSFIYGMFFLSTIKGLRYFKIKKNIYKFIMQLIFMLLHVSLFYYLLYKINGGILSIYVAIFFAIGMFFCKVLYFNDKKSWNNYFVHYIMIIMEMV